VWVIVPPMQRAGVQISRAEDALLTAVSNLIREGESVLLSVYPSTLPRYGQIDRWAQLPAPFGLEMNTSSVLYERVQTGVSESQVRLAQLVNDYPTDHRISRAIAGLDLRLTLPVSISLEPDQADAARTVLAHVAANPDRWLEAQWTTDPDQQRQPSPQTVLERDVPIAVAAERSHPAHGGTQRLIAVGAGAWMLSFESDLVVPIGGNRVALVYPGNNELMLATVAWLAGMDDLIAASPISQEVSRLRDVTEAARLRWLWITVAGLPGACALLGLLVWMVRRT
jgi:hypothetical protein